MKADIKNVRISHIVTALPKTVVEISSMANVFDQDLESIMKHTGVERIHVASESQCTSDLSEAAANYIFENLGVSRESIGAIVFVSQTPDFIFPPTSTCLQDRLKLRRDITAFDINYGCSGFIYGLFQAAILLNSANIERVLVLAGDTLTRTINQRDRSLRLLIGDGSSATILEKGEGRLYFNIKTDGSGAQHVILPAGGFRNPKSETTKMEHEKEFGNIRSDENFFMNGMEVMNFALKEIPPLIKETLSDVNWTDADVGFYGLHQANKFLIEYVSKKARLDVNKVPISVRNFGNTSPATIPLMLTDQHEKLRQEGRLEKAILCGFGVGLSWGAVTVDLSKTEFVGPIEV
ncbi:beta-ketoacyl-acyl-carrier-protein synthase III [Leptospira ryugenii]|uniref:Beta-ketoacyl-acyl-carrier-protein synthase III n=1 Tax=Leptospira ryugenii TaxID=1917863 RepID=A0A2P2DW41_9LEPT|nr:ketoacyl-ACP synthase III [Leptospira ryugenii]GBF48843.1 beta-ketoacyl-acyl-carrier-protein synthase III [Leptospira ryugenii]